MTTDCDLCTAPVADMANVCSRCAAPLITDLRDVPSLDAELDVTVFKQAKMTAGNAGGGHSDEKPLPVNFDADARGRKLKAVLGSWCALVSDKRGIPGPLDGLATSSRWLIEHVTWLRHHEAGADAVAEIRDAVRDVRIAIDRPRERLYTGQCDGCGFALYAPPNASHAICPVCVGPEGERTYYKVSERREAMLAAMAVMCMGPTEAAYALSILVHPIPAATIRKWASRGKLEPAAVDERGRNVYRLADIAELMVPAQQAG